MWYTMLTTNKMPETKQNDERSCVPKVNMVASLLHSDMIDNNTEYQNVLSAGFLQSQHCCLNVDHNIKNHIILIILCVCVYVSECACVHIQQVLLLFTKARYFTHIAPVHLASCINEDLALYMYHARSCLCGWGLGTHTIIHEEWPILPWGTIVPYPAGLAHTDSVPVWWTGIPV